VNVKIANEAWLAVLPLAPVPAIGMWIAMQARHLRINQQLKAILVALLCAVVFMGTVLEQGHIYQSRTHVAPRDSVYFLALVVLEAASGLAVGFYIAYRMRNRGAQGNP
jgi:hypothetical protein